MTHKKTFSKTDLSKRVAQADITNLENRQQFFGFLVFGLWLVGMTFAFTCDGGKDGYSSGDHCGKGSTDK